MRGTFNGSQSPYVKDWAREDFYRRQEQERQDRDAAEKCAHWLAVQLVGLTFTTLPELRDVCLGLVEARYGMDDRVAGVVARAITSLWLGQCERALIMERAVRAVKDEQGVSFVAA